MFPLGTTMYVEVSGYTFVSIGTQYHPCCLQKYVHTYIKRVVSFIEVRSSSSQNVLLILLLLRWLCH